MLVSRTLVAMAGALCAAMQVHALNSFDALRITKEFADHYLAPNNVEVANSVNSSLFAENVKGRVDPTTNFDGRELGTEYVFGLFVHLNPKEPHPFGSPISYNITHLAVQHMTISTTLVFEFEYALINKVYPIQIDVWFLINQLGQVEQYDITFRRWSWAMQTVVPQMLPIMAQRRNIPANSTQNTILTEYLGYELCTVADKECKGDNAEFANFDDCMVFVRQLAVGTWDRMGDNNLLCRMIHVGMVHLRPAEHCPHIGPSGGHMCVPRDYESVVRENHFPKGWIAPKYVTPENKEMIEPIPASSAYSLDPLLEISMSLQQMHSWTPTFYPTAIFGWFLFFYAMAKGLEWAFGRFHRIYPTISHEHQRNVVVYLMATVITTIALGLQLAATPSFAGVYRLWMVECLRMGGVLVSGLYIFELVYRAKMRLSMIAHHFLTIVAISWTVSMFEYTQSMSFMNSAIIWLFQATLEQPIFIGLMGYRLKWKSGLVAGILKFAAVITFVLKWASAIALIVYWGLEQRFTYRSADYAWSALLWIIAVGLLMTQIWGSYVTWLLACRIGRGEARRKSGAGGENGEGPRPNSDHSTGSSPPTSLSDTEIGTPNVSWDGHQYGQYHDAKAF